MARLLRLSAAAAAFGALLALAAPASAQEPDAVAETDVLTEPEAERGKFVALAIGLGLGIAAMGGALGQGRATASALDGLARNPGAYDRVFTPFILGMVLIESLVIYSLVISLILLGSLG